MVTIGRCGAAFGPVVLVGWSVLAVTGCSPAPEAVSDPFHDARSGPPNIVWIVADTETVADADLENFVGSGARFETTGAVPGHPAPMSRAAMQSVLLTGMSPAALNLGERGFVSLPPVGAAVLPEHLRRLGYYTSRSGPARHDLAVTSGDHPVALDPAEADQPGLLGAWDAAGRDTDWRGREHDWDLPCTVAFGCGSTAATGPRPFFALFNLEPREGETDVANIIADLEADGLVGQTIVFFIGVGPGPFDLAVRWPEGDIERALVGADPVSLVDLAPTVLALAGGDIPDGMQGRVFLEPSAGIRMKHPSRRAVSNQASVTRPLIDEARPRASAPEGYPNGGLFHVAPVVELSCDTEGSTIIYTTERVAPFYWRLYREPFRMRFWTLRAKCGRLGYQDSPTVTYEFDIE